MAEAKTVNVAAAIFYKDNKILAARRADADNAGFWEFPGGKVEAGETSEQALRREIQEELHCNVQAALGESEEPIADPEIHSELRWLAQNKLLDVQWLPADIELIKQLGTFWNDIFASQHL